MYEAVIESSLAEGSLTYGEAFHRGATDHEVLLSTHICHPSLANDNCSGMALLTALIKRIARKKTHYSYRFLFGPGTLGAISWLARNTSSVHKIKHGIVLSCVGDGGGPTYKKSRIGDAFIDRAFIHVLKHASSQPNILEFFPYGYDERQFCSPGFNLPVGLFQRSQFGTFPEYHCSDDNLDFIKPEHLAASYQMVTSVLDVIEGNRYYARTNPFCEPQLGRRGLYSSVGGTKGIADRNMAMLWVLNLSDEQHSLLDIAERANMPFEVIADVARILAAKGLLEEIPSTSAQT
jgi:aminopeptidase-like protein